MTFIVCRTDAQPEHPAHDPVDRVPAQAAEFRLRVQGHQGGSAARLHHRSVQPNHLQPSEITAGRS